MLLTRNNHQCSQPCELFSLLKERLQETSGTALSNPNLGRDSPLASLGCTQTQLALVWTVLDFSRISGSAVYVCMCVCGMLLYVYSMCVCLHVYGVYSCMLVWRPEADWLSSSGILVNLTILARHRAASPQNPHVSTSQHWDYRHAHPHLALYWSYSWKSELWSSRLYSKCFYHWAIFLALLSFLFCIAV